MIIMKVINAEGLIVGRFATVAAKQALLGEEVVIVNCEKAVISGRPEAVFAKYKQVRDRGVPKRGPYMSRMPDRLVRRMVRGMLPMANARGKEAFARIMCYIGTPEEHAGKESIVIAGANASKLPTMNFITVGDVCKKLGARWN